MFFCNELNSTFSGSFVLGNCLGAAEASVERVENRQVICECDRVYKLHLGSSAYELKSSTDIGLVCCLTMHGGRAGTVLWCDF